MQNMNSGRLTANYVDIEARRIFHARIEWHDGKVSQIVDLGREQSDAAYLIPGFIDAHVHIESSMLPPVEFARIAVRHGTIATVSDPHEIANVLGLEGVRYMQRNSSLTPFHCFFGAPSCVPATPFETAGAELANVELEQLLDDPEIYYLSEMMNFPGVLNSEPEVMARLALAHERGLPVDGHAPGLSGEDAAHYAAAGITTDHECLTLVEAEAKLATGMKILIREGSAARNFEALHQIITTHTDSVMLCSDDKHPDDLVAGHIDRLAARAVALGHNLFDVLQCVCINPIKHYRLPLGQLRLGDPMDGALLSDLKGFRVERTWLAGELVAEQGRGLLPFTASETINRFNARPLSIEQLQIRAGEGALRVIEALDGELITRELLEPAPVESGWVVPDPSRDLLQLCVLNRYQVAEPAFGFIRGFGLKQGAIASSVAHDSHNIVAVGVDQASLLSAINRVVEAKGGIALSIDGRTELLPLSIAGLMSSEDGDEVAKIYAKLNRQARTMGSGLRAPFMTLSFMALLVIPELKLSDKGLFDGGTFRFASLFKGLD